MCEALQGYLKWQNFKKIWTSIDKTLVRSWYIHTVQYYAVVKVKKGKYSYVDI